MTAPAVVSVAATATDGAVQLRFSQAIDLFAMTPDEALHLAALLIRRAGQA